MTNITTEEIRDLYDMYESDIVRDRYMAEKHLNNMGAEIAEAFLDKCGEVQNIKAIIEKQRKAMQNVLKVLRKSFIDNDTGDKHNDYDGLYYDMELIEKSLNRALKEALALTERDKEKAE
jgi:DNA topoisomerase IB